MADGKMVGFGPKMAWLAVRADQMPGVRTVEQRPGPTAAVAQPGPGTGEPASAVARVLATLRLRDLGPVPWRDGVDLAYLTDDRVMVTPPLPGAGAARWLLVAGWWLALRDGPSGEGLDVAGLSADLGVEVQFFRTHRVAEAHQWERAVDGRVVRAFGYVGESGEITRWQGAPCAAETAIGIVRRPGVVPGSAGDVLVGEDDVLRIAAAWSVDPRALDGRPAPGPLRAAAAP